MYGKPHWHIDLFPLPCRLIDNGGSGNGSIETVSRQGYVYRRKERSCYGGTDEQGRLAGNADAIGIPTMGLAV